MSSPAWPRVRLSDVMNPVSRPVSVELTNEYSLLGVRLDGRGPFLRERVLGSQTSATTLYQVRARDFIYSRLFAWRGAFGVVPAQLDGCYVSGEFPTFLPVSGRLDSQYLRLWFRLPGVLAQVEALCTGSTPVTRNRFKEHRFLALQLPLPPLDEQWRIVARVEALESRIEEARGLRRQAVSDAHVLVEVAAAARIAIVQREFGPAGTLGSLVVTRTGGTPSKGVPAFWGGSVPWISPKDMKVADLMDSREHISEYALAARAAALIPANSLLVVVRSGILKRLIPVAISRRPVAINQDIKALFLPTNLTPEYLRWWFLGNSRDLLACVKGGTTVQSLIWERVCQLPLAVPPLAEQQRIVGYLDGIQAKVASLLQLQDQTTAEMDALLPAILERAFSGEL